MSIEYKNDCPRENYDRKVLIKRLKSFYDTNDMEVIKIKLRKDLKTVKGIKKILDHTQYDIEEIIFHLAKLYDNLFKEHNLEFSLCICFFLKIHFSE